MRYLLAIDIGNTNITMGMFRGRRLVKRAKIATREVSLYKGKISRFVAGRDIDRIVISSVVPKALSRLKKTLPKAYRVLILGKNAKVPIKNLYTIKGQVGQDRLVNAFAVKMLYGAPAVVIDFGTAITFDIVSKKGEYLGGLILPGIDISLSSLYEKTALLPKVKLDKSRHIIGKDTANSMRGGILFGFGAMCDGLVAKYKNILGKGTKIIATGGNAKLVKRYAKSIQIVDKDLPLKGLRLMVETLH